MGAALWPPPPRPLSSPASPALPRAPQGPAAPGPGSRAPLLGAQSRGSREVGPVRPARTPASLGRGVRGLRLQAAPQGSPMLPRCSLQAAMLPDAPPMLPPAEPWPLGGAPPQVGLRC